MSPLPTSSLYALLAGTFAALGSVFAKLLSSITSSRPLYTLLCTFISCAQPNEYLFLVLRGLALAGIIVSNALMWGLFTKALNTAASSTTVTVLNSCANFCLTALLGHMLFDEVLSLRWWFGASLIVIGTVLMSTSTDSSEQRRSKRITEKTKSKVKKI